MKKNRVTEHTTNEWTREELLTIYRLRQENKSWTEIADIVKTKTWKAISRKYGRMNWELFIKDPKKEPNGEMPRKWDNDDMIQLDAFLQANQSYEFIAEKVGRSIGSVESRAQHTDWKAWREIQKTDPETTNTDIDSNIEQSRISQYIVALLEVCKCDFKRIDSIKEDYFLEKVNLDKAKLLISFKELKEKARAELV